MANQARKIQRLTAMSYMTCLAVYNGELVLTPIADDCIVRDALKQTRNPRAPKADAVLKDCQCPRCDP